MTSWVSTIQELPVVPKGKHAISILVNVYDPVYEECSPGNGSSVYQARWDGKDFLEPALHMTEESLFIPIADVVTHWAYMPETISCKNCWKDDPITTSMYCSFCVEFSNWTKI